MELFDNERFISEVEMRPAIWNTRSEAHADREKRNQAWNELCLKFIPNFAKKSIGDKNIVGRCAKPGFGWWREKAKHPQVDEPTSVPPAPPLDTLPVPGKCRVHLQFTTTQLQRKWKSFRDCFKREHAKQIRELQSDSASSTRKTYKYYQNLSFLIKVSEPRTEASPAPQEEKDSSDLPTADKARRKRRKTSLNAEALEPEQEILRSFPHPFPATQTEVGEADRNFALSLLPHFKQIPYEYKLDAQMEILMVLKKYKPQRYDYLSQTGDHHSVIPRVKLSPLASEDGQPESDDSSINENLYY